MTFLIDLLCGETIVLLAGFVGLVVIQILTGEINTEGLLYGAKGNGSQYISPERVQLLLFTLAFAFQYLSQLLQKPAAFPTVPESSIALLAGSHAVYLGGKLSALLIGRE